MLASPVALVTGAGRGIGARTAHALAEAGARVAVTSRRGDDARRVAASIGRGAVGVACEVSDPASVFAAVAEIAERLGPVGILVNNAGTVQPIGLLHETDPAAWAAALAATLAGAATAARAVLPAMLDTGHGTIVNLSSGAAHGPVEGWSAYCAAKAGLAMLTRSLALEYGSRGVRAFGFAPGLVDTGMQAEIRASGMNAISALPQTALADPDQPARAIAYLCSSAADDLAGRELDIREAAFRERVGLPALKG